MSTEAVLGIFLFWFPLAAIVARYNIKKKRGWDVEGDNWISETIAWYVWPPLDDDKKSTAITLMVVVIFFGGNQSVQSG